MIKNFLNEIGGVNLVDIGSSGNLDWKWKSIIPFINLIGFDPNAEECARMTNLPHSFKSVKYLPYAIGGKKNTNTLYKTKSIYCYSLLPPNSEWLKRFSFYELFERVGEETLETEVLSDIAEVRAMDVDVLKTDTQGLELPIFKSSAEVLNKAFYVETETGFVENYIGETTYSQIDEFMRANNFMLFDLNTSHRISRNNLFKNEKTGSEQLLWCEAVWLKDYIELAKQNKISNENFGRQKLLKSLILCSLQGCIDYGFEIASLGYELKILSQKELFSLESKDAWIINSSNVKVVPAYNSTLINYALRLLPVKIRRQIKQEIDKAIHQKNLLRL